MKKFNLCYLLLLFLVKMHGLFLWKKKKVITIINTFQKVLDESEGCKPNKKWIHEGSAFYNRFMK